MASERTQGKKGKREMGWYEQETGKTERKERKKKEEKKKGRGSK